MKIKKASELLWLLAIIFVAFGVALCGKANLGVSMLAAPAFIISEAITPFCDFFTVGVTEYIIQGLLIIILQLIFKQFIGRYLLTFGVAVIYGYTLNFFIWIMDGFTLDGIISRWIMLFLGDIIIAFGIACFFRTYLPIQAHEIFVKEIAGKFSLNINKTKLVFDISFLFISVALAIVIFGDLKSFDFSTIYYNSFHNIGLGTLVTTLINSPIIALCGKLVDLIFESKPRYPKLAKFLDSI